LSLQKEKGAEIEMHEILNRNDTEPLCRQLIQQIDKNEPVKLAFFFRLDEPLWRDAKFIVIRDFVVAAALANVEAALLQLLLMLLGADQVALAIIIGVTIPDFTHVALTPRLAG
jgi:hypothetical protein